MCVEYIGRSKYMYCTLWNPGKREQCQASASCACLFQSKLHRQQQCQTTTLEYTKANNNNNKRNRPEPLLLIIIHWETFPFIYIYYECSLFNTIELCFSALQSGNTVIKMHLPPAFVYLQRGNIPFKATFFRVRIRFFCVYCVSVEFILEAWNILSVLSIANWTRAV